MLYRRFISDLFGNIGHFSTKIMNEQRAIVVSGPSGGGKSTLLNRLFKDYPDCFAYSVSHTTRQPRQGEQNGRDYHFVSREDMRRDIEAAKFLEYAEFGGNIYGTSKRAVEEVQSTGRICILDVEIQGVRSIHKTDLNARYILIKPPSLEILEQRLRDRKTETDESLKKRLDHARQDMKAAEEEPQLFDHVIINDDLEVAYREFIQILEPGSDLCSFLFIYCTVYCTYCTVQCTVQYSIQFYYLTTVIQYLVTRKLLFL